MKNEMTPVLFSTENREKFFGYIKNDSFNEDKMSLKAFNVRNIIYYSSDVGGFFGLSENGPTKNCRISATAEFGLFFKITSIINVSESAIANWEKAEVFNKNIKVDGYAQEDIDKSGYLFRHGIWE